MSVVSIRNVSFSYQTDMPEYNLSDISLEIQQGECVLLCGKSGSGKTTMTKLVNGLIPHFEEGKKTGTVLLDGNEVDTMPMYQISLKVASIFQDPKSQFFNIDTEDEIVFSLENQGVGIDALEKRLDVTIKDLQLSTLVKKSLFEMSGGEKQIIAFACAYALNPDILVMDEPSSNLDLGAIEVIREILVKMKKQGKTILIAEHRFSYLNGLIDRAVWIEKGKISAHYTGEQFFALSEQERKVMGLRRLTPYREVCLKRFTGESSPAITPSLELKNVEVSFGKQSILQNISLSLQSGDVAAIIGTNGVGKTSLCRTICGFLDCKDGEIIINGTTLKKKQRLQKTYIVMQDTNYQLFAESVLDECFLGNPLVTESQVEEVLEQLDLIDVKGRHPQSLSGGQKQRLAIAVAILTGKEIIIFDEPTSGLDYSSMMSVSKLINHLSQMGMIVLLITHDMEFLEATCNKCFQLLPNAVYETNEFQTDTCFIRT